MHESTTIMERPEPETVTMTLPEDGECWRAVISRDRSYDGIFVYAVATTGIYCRPSCPSRRPRRENVRFFAPDSASPAGYRACRRCRPDDAAGAPADAAIRRAIDWIEVNLDEPLTLERLGREVGLSPFHLQRTFRDRVGVSPRAYQAARRLDRFRGHARDGATVGRATYEAGFNSSRSLYERAAGGLGMTPGRYRRGGAGLDIRYTIVDSPLGRLLVGATAKGVCAVAIGDDDVELETSLGAEFPRACVSRDEAGLREWAEGVARQAAGADPGMAVPTDLRGTVFQLRVWAALRMIPAGETRTYAEVAAEIGAPRAVRAVAGACAGNHAALVVPCHRVIRSDGGLGGYRWGMDRKRILLESESDERNR